jgi:hypothetical protein
LRKDKYIAEPGENIPVQTRLNPAPGFRQTNLQVFPRVEASREALDAILATGGYKGNDWEFRPDYTPTIVSVTSLDRVFSAPWDASLRDRLRQPFLDGVAPDGTRYHWVAHSTVGADKAVVDKVYNQVTSLADWSDSMLSHYLANQHLVKAPDKDESDDSGSLGFMDLWTTASLITDFSNWKTCRSAICPGSDPGTWGYSLLAPCPTHSPMSYCGIDGFVSPVAHVHNMEILKKHNLSERFYRDLMTLSEVCWKMEKNGIKIDRAHVEKTNAMMDAKKNALFAYTLDRRGKPVYAEFNPKSAPQVLKFFREAGINLKKTDRDAIAEAVEENLRLAGYGDGWKGYEEDPDREISPALQRLIDLKVFKTEGKGLDPWFGDKYLRDDDLVHPRFVVTGTSTGRLSSSKPNFMNIPRKGVFGEHIRQSLIPYEPDLDLCKADFAQLELRIVLYLAGEPYSGNDAFTWLVDQTGDAMFKVAKDFDPVKYAKNPAAAARDIAKSVSHGGNYLEGLTLIDPRELTTSSIKTQINNGALRIYPDWTFHGKVVGFTGGNLAERLFRNRTHASRKQALDIQEGMFFKRFSIVRKWQKTVLDFVQENGYVQSPTGRFLKLYGTPDEIAKVAVAFLGQGVGADHVQGIMLRFYEEQGKTPLLQVHDELIFQQPKSLTNDAVVEYIRLMEGETWRLPGFTCPIEAKRGDNWKEMQTIWKG